MLKFVIAPDSFKECLTAREVAEALEQGIRDELGDGVQTVLLPIADGGEGTLEAVSRPDERYEVTVTGPGGQPVAARYAVHGTTAIVEMASAAGLMLTDPQTRRAGDATTYGVGQLIRLALERGAENVLLTVGGSATNDGGCGMLAALGARFLRADGTAFVPTGNTLSEIAELDTENLIFQHTSCKFTIATDVQNPLLGMSGATQMFAPQKGATKEELERMEAGMAHLARLLERKSGRPVATALGVGAGGGIAAPLLAFANAEIVSGIDAVLATINFGNACKGADAVLTGEGRMDRQSLLGKAISGVVRAAGDVPVYAFVGCLGDPVEQLLPLGLAGIETVRSLALTNEDSMKNAATYLRQLGRRFARGWYEGKGA